MKIIKIAQNGKMIAVDPNAPADANVQVQNAQTALTALNQLVEDTKIPDVLTTRFTEQLNTNITEVATEYQLIGLVQSMDFTPTIDNFRTEVTERLDQIIVNSDNFNMLRNMGILSSVDQLRDPNYVNTQNTILTKKIQQFLDSAGEQAI